MFEIKNVSKKYGDEFALNSVSLEIGKGMNFIVGASGSGKTSLLKIISAMEQCFDGEVYYCGKDIKSMKETEKSYLYNNIFGFVWQDFNLLEDSTVLENVLLPDYLKSNSNKKMAEKALKDLKIFDIANKKVKYLSGGQKQRVAIARELMKSPQVIIADEPTSALDEKTSTTIMDILRSLSKTRTVIVVTHDTSLITQKDNVFELDKGELVSKTDIAPTKTSKINLNGPNVLSLRNSFAITKINIKNKLGRFIISMLTLIIAATLLLTTLSGAISGSSKGEFDKLIKQYGQGLLDISIVNSFTSAGGTDGNKKDEPNADVSQKIDGLYEKYINDKRVNLGVFLQAFNDIKINLNGKNYSITSSGSVPVINKIITGKIPNGKTNEVVVPESFVKNAGFTNENIIGKEIEFSCSMYNWDTGKPVSKNAKIKAIVVGVIDTTTMYEYEGQITKYSVDDSFFFSKVATDDMRKQAGFKDNNVNFLIRAKTPSDMIEIKDELSKKGIVPLGRFELVEDMVRLENQTTEQSGLASVMIAVLAFVMITAIFLTTGVMRRREYAIYKVSGFNKKSLHILNFVETLSLFICSVILTFITSPLLNLATKNIFKVNILDAKMLIMGVLLLLLLSAVTYAVTAICYVKTNITVVLKSGDR